MLKKNHINSKQLICVTIDNEISCLSRISTFLYSNKISIYILSPFHIELSHVTQFRDDNKKSTYSSELWEFQDKKKYSKAVNSIEIGFFLSAKHVYYSNTRHQL